MQASYWPTRAELRAGMPKLERGGWHCYRRKYASDRKHHPDVDTAASAGWRDLSTVKRSYQCSDPATMLKAIENAPERHQSGTVPQSSVDGATS